MQIESYSPKSPPKVIKPCLCLKHPHQNPFFLPYNNPTFCYSITAFFLQTLINWNNRFSNQISGFMLNAICFSPKTAVTVVSPVCPTPSSTAFLQAQCGPSSSLIALFELKALSSLSFPLPSLLFTQLSMPINYSSFAEKAATCLP